MTYQFPRCQIIPLPDHQVSFQIDGQDRLRWHFGPSYPRPFFYPLVGPSGDSLTRMGHPGAANHDHHRSVWFAHHDVQGVDFWSDNTAARIRQKHWRCYGDGDDEAVMGALLGWYGGEDGRELMEQEVIAAVRPGDDGETLVELQGTFRPKADVVELGKTNFGFLAVRVAKHISAYFGGGELTSSEDARGEPQIFEQSARWMDYTGPSASRGSEGITYFDHPANLGYPSHWHVREDGWMGASLCMHGPRVTTSEQPLTLRYLLHAHGGDIEAERANHIADKFAKTKGFVVERSKAKHRHYEVRRIP